jgi:signal transduction histidine kinase
MGRNTVLFEPGAWLRWLPTPRVQLPPSIRAFRTPFLIGIAYYFGAQAAFLIGTLSDRIFAPFWPPNAILFCTLALAPKRRWGFYIAATFPAHMIAEITVAMPFGQSMVAFATNCMVAVLSACCLQRFLREPPWFGTLSSAAIYVLITSGVSPAVAALGGAFVQIVGEGTIANYWTYWGNWYLSNALGSATLGPLFLIWFNPRPEGLLFISRRKIEGTILALCLFTTCAIAFHVSEGTVNPGFLPALLYTPLPFLFWAAIRFGKRGASGAILVVTIVSIWQSLRDSTVFNGANPEVSVLALQIFLLGIAVPVFLLGASIEELHRSGEATRRLAGALLRTQDEERRRIARELHDSTGQNLVMASLMARQVQSQVTPACEPAMTDLRNVLQNAITEIRTVSFLLHPPALETGGLGLALQSYVQGFSSRTAIQVDLELGPDLGRMRADVELVLFRVVQEALSNIWRHSGSAIARIYVSRQFRNGGEQIALRIEDVGKGIPNDIRLSTLSPTKARQQVPSGLGLIGMRERLNQVGGQLEIDSMTGKTVIRATVRLDPETPGRST